MRKIEIERLVETVEAMFIRINFEGSSDLEKMLRYAREKESSQIGREVIEQLMENKEIARKENIPICQDTGLALVFLEIGQDVHVIGGELEAGINEGIRRAYERCYLRKSVCHPLTRHNTRDNTPSIVHVRIVPGEKIRIRGMAKGGGSENCSEVRMLEPSKGKEGVKEFLLELIERIGPNPCPPLIVGIGLGGNLEKAALLSKEALFEPYGKRHEDPEIASFEVELINETNKSGIGPQGYGGTITVFDLHIKTFPCHIASLPCAVSIECHAHRTGEIII